MQARETSTPRARPEIRRRAAHFLLLFPEAVVPPSWRAESGRYGVVVSTGTPLPSSQLTVGHVGPSAADRVHLVRRARSLAWIGLGWHLVEAAVAVAAGLVAGSVALVGFGAVRSFRVPSANTTMK